MAEFLLPYPAPDDMDVDTWIGGFFGISIQEVRTRLSQKWGPSAFSTLADSLVSCESFGVSDEGSGFLFGQFEKSYSGRLGERWYLPPPMSSSQIDTFIESTGIRNDAVLRDFLLHFAGIRTDLEYSGGFVSPDSWELFSIEHAEAFDFLISGYENWIGALIFYEALNGSMALVNPEGAVAWWDTAEMEIAGRFTLEFFISQYADSLRSDCVFDCYFGDFTNGA